MSKISKKKLGKIARFQQGLQVDVDCQFFLKKENYVQFLRIVDYTNSKETPRYIENNKNSPSYVSQNDVVMIRYGSQTAGRVVIGKEGIIANNMFRIIPIVDGIENRYLYYFLKNQAIHNYLMNGQSSSTMPAITFDMMNDIDIYLPSIKDQQKIALVLYSLDSKIELNNKINTELEAMAKTLYNYWFVQFDFPDKNGKPYKTSGGKMIYSEELKKEIPEGWEVRQMNQLLKKNTEKFNLNIKNHDLDTIDLSVMPSATMCLNEKSSSSSFDTNLFKLNKYDILFGGIRPYLLKAGFSPFDGLVTGTVHSFRVKDQNEYNFAIITMVHDSMFKFAVSNSKGTKMPVVGADDLLCYKVAYNKDVIKKFNELISFKEIISHNIIENQKLSELRNWLLPMLMNGQVKVK